MKQTKIQTCLSKPLLALILVAAFFSCKKSDTKPAALAPVISYNKKIVSVNVGEAIPTLIPDSSKGGSVTQYSIYPGLPKGLSLNQSNGVISGTPADSLNPTRFVISAYGPGGLGRDTITVAIGTVGFVYGSTGNYIFTKGSQDLATTALAPTVLAGTFKKFFIDPNSTDLTTQTGLKFDPVTGKISGTPTVVTSKTVTPTPIVFTVTGITTDDKATSTTITITVNDVAPTFSYSFSGSLAAGSKYVISSGNGKDSVTTPAIPTSTGATVKAYRLAPNSQALPAGLSIDSATGKIIGTPTAAGSVNVIVRGLTLGGANPTDVNVSVNVTATAQTPAVNYAMVVGNKAIVNGSITTVFDTLVSPTSTGGSFYLTNNTNIASTGGAPSTLTGTTFTIAPVLTAGQISSYSASPALTSFSIAPGTGIFSGTPKITTATATTTVTLTNAITGSANGSYVMNVLSNAPYVTYNSSVGGVGATKYSADSAKSWSGGYGFFFIKGRDITSARNGNDSCFYTPAQLSPATGSTATSYSIYPAQLLPGLNFNTTTGALTGTPTISTLQGNLYNSVSYTIMGKKTDGSFTLFQIVIKVFENASDFATKTL